MALAERCRSFRLRLRASGLQTFCQWLTRRPVSKVTSCSVRLNRQRCLQSQLKWLTRRPALKGSLVAAHIFYDVGFFTSSLASYLFLFYCHFQGAWPCGCYHMLELIADYHVDLSVGDMDGMSGWDLPLQRSSHPHCTCENAARYIHRYIHIRPEVVEWAPPV